MNKEIIIFDTSAKKGFYPRVDVCTRAKRVAISQSRESRRKCLKFDQRRVRT